MTPGWSLQRDGPDERHRPRDLEFMALGCMCSYPTRRAGCFREKTKQDKD